MEGYAEVSGTVVEPWLRYWGCSTQFRWASTVCA